MATGRFRIAIPAFIRHAEAELQLERGAIV
jgi:hypothetical protein